MKTEIVQNGHFQREFAENHEVLGMISHLENQIRTIQQPFTKGANSSSLLKQEVQKLLIDWNENLLIQSGFPTRKLPYSHVQVDFQNEFNFKRPMLKLQVTLEIFGDNRQAVAANLLKLELAGRNFSKYGQTIGIGVCIEKSLKARGWDGSTATSDEYEFALLHTYARFIETPLILFVVSD